MGRALLIVLAVLAVAAAGVAFTFAHDMAAARIRLSGRSQTVQTPFGTMEYAKLGIGVPVLAIHGASGGFDQSLDMTGALAARGYRLIAPSRFGYLRSSLPANATTEMQADAYAQLLDRLGIDKVVVIGISAGAWSALQFAIRHPDRCEALVLLVPADYLPKGTSIHGGAIVRAIFNSDFIAWAALKLAPIVPGGMSETMLGTNAAVLREAAPAEKARVQLILEHLLPVSARMAGTGFDVQTAATRTPYPLEKIACPVLAISSEDDAFGTAMRARFIAAHVRNGTAIVFPTGGHALVGHHDDALAEVAAFLKTVRERQPSR